MEIMGEIQQLINDIYGSLGSHAELTEMGLGRCSLCTMLMGKLETMTDSSNDSVPGERVRDLVRELSPIHVWMRHGLWRRRVCSLHSYMNEVVVEVN